MPSLQFDWEQPPHRTVPAEDLEEVSQPLKSGTSSSHRSMSSDHLSTDVVLDDNSVDKNFLKRSRKHKPVSQTLSIQPEKIKPQSISSEDHHSVELQHPPPPRQQVVLPFRPTILQPPPRQPPIAPTASPGFILLPTLARAQPMASPICLHSPRHPPKLFPLYPDRVPAEFSSLLRPHHDDVDQESTDSHIQKAIGHLHRILKGATQARGQKENHCNTGKTLHGKFAERILEKEPQKLPGVHVGGGWHLVEEANNEFLNKRHQQQQHQHTRCLSTPTTNPN